MTRRNFRALTAAATAAATDLCSLKKAVRPIQATSVGARYLYLTLPGDRGLPEGVNNGVPAWWS